MVILGVHQKLVAPGHAAHAFKQNQVSAVGDEVKVVFTDAVGLPELGLDRYLAHVDLVADGALDVRADGQDPLLLPLWRLGSELETDVREEDLNSTRLKGIKLT
jgi:hypothetical protein